MTKKDYILIAEAIRDFSIELELSVGNNQQYYDLIDDLIIVFIDRLSAKNIRFDSKKFEDYCLN